MTCLPVIIFDNFRRKRYVTIPLQDTSVFVIDRLSAKMLGTLETKSELLTRPSQNFITKKELVPYPPARYEDII